jgi:hypothetical protein
MDPPIMLFSELLCNFVHTSLENPDPDNAAKLASIIAGQELRLPVTMFERPDGECDILAGHL